MQIAVSGLGRIGRSFVRALLLRETGAVSLRAFHDIEQIDSLAYLLQHDSVRGAFSLPIATSEDEMMIGEQRISFTQSSSPPEWGAIHIDIVVDCTGRHTSRKTAAEHLARGAKMVLVSAPVDEPDRTVVFGYNHQLLTWEDRIVSAASCTTNCLIHMLLAVQQIAQIEFGLMS